MTMLSSSSPVTASTISGGRAMPGALEHVDLGRVALEHDRAELGLELLEAVAPLLDERHLVPHAGRASA